jgi:hypothetical protein
MGGVAGAILGEMQSIRADLLCERRIIGDEQEQVAPARDFRERPGQFGAVRRLACAQDHQASARQCACGGKRVG